MKALVWHGRRDLRLDDVPEPHDPSPGEAIVEVAYCGLCGTDLHEYLEGPVVIRPGPHPLTGKQPPVTLGHEMSGRVAAIGAEDDGVAIGTRVTVDPCWRCGRCFWCRRGEYQLCRIGGGVGLASDGALARFVRVPAAGLVPLPDSVDDQIAALVEPLAVGLHAVERGRLRLGEIALIQGFGPVGAAVLLSALAAGAGAAFVVEPVEERRTKALELGATATFDPSADDMRRSIRHATGGAGADVVFDCTGRPDKLAAAVDASRRGGRIVVAGVAHGIATLELNRLVLSEREVIGTLGYCHDLPKVVRLLAGGAFAAAPLVTGVIKLSSSIEDGFGVLSRPNAHMKILVDVAGDTGDQPD